jgi:hypothetical protein
MLINKAKVRELALKLSREKRNGKFTRVGKSFFDKINARVHALVASEVHTHPSLGKTLK